LGPAPRDDLRRRGVPLDEVAEARHADVGAHAVERVARGAGEEPRRRELPALTAQTLLLGAEHVEDTAEDALEQPELDEGVDAVRLDLRRRAGGVDPRERARQGARAGRA